MTQQHQSNFDSAIRDADGQVDSGYYGGMMFTYMAIAATAFMAIGLSVQAYFDEQHKFDALMLGQGMGLVATAYAGLMLAIGGFKRLDRPAPGAVTTATTTKQTSTEITTPP